MSMINRETVVAAPLRLVYDAWVQFESYPQFLEGVEAVALVDANSLRWRESAERASDADEWDVEIVEQAPDSHIRWEASGGPVRVGAVLVDAVDEARTRVRMEMDVPRPEDETVIAMRAERDLAAFKGYMEARASQLSGWRTPPAPGGGA